MSKVLIAGIVAAGVAAVAVAKVAVSKAKENEKIKEAGKNIVNDSKELGKAVAEVTKDSIGAVKAKYAERKTSDILDESDIEVDENGVTTVCEGKDEFEQADTTISDDEIIEEDDTDEIDCIK
jgi:flagellar basal body rod protein FlgG